MKVKHFNTYPHGGAANAARRIHRGIVQQNVDSQFFYRLSDQAPPTESRTHLIQLRSEPIRSPGLLRPIYRKMEKRRRRKIHRLFDIHLSQRPAEEHEVFSMAQLPERTFLDWDRNSSDLVHLHWLAFMADYPSFFGSIPDHVPIVWTLHDMSAFTGGCHYSSGCEDFMQGCGNCRQLHSPAADDVSYDSWKAKRAALKNKSIHVVAPGRWMIELAKQSDVWPAGTEFTVIHYGLELSQFPDIDLERAREAIQIDSQPILIGFGADDLSNPRKGFSHLINALNLVNAQPKAHRKTIELAVFGAGAIPAVLKQHFRVHEFGFVQDPVRLANIYAACNFVIVPSLEDNQPQVGLEAMACGRPVIGFDTGGIPEYVIPKQTGVLVEARNDQALAQAIIELANSTIQQRELGTQSRELVCREFEINQQSSRYVDLYRELISHGKRKMAA